MHMFYKTLPDDRTAHSEYWLEDVSSMSVMRKDYLILTAVTGITPVLRHSETIEDFLIKDVDPKAKQALQEYLDKVEKKK
jgi:hypothetical protein